jgi:hypothetical protein
MVSIFPDGDVAEHSLLHMDVLGDGMIFRKATLRRASTMTYGPRGVSRHSKWEELRNGKWEIVFEYEHSL